MRIKVGRTGAGDVVLVDVELRVGVGRAGGVECQWDVGGVEGVEPDRLAPRSIVVEGLWDVLSVSATGARYDQCSFTVDDVPAIWKVVQFSAEFFTKRKGTYNCARSERDIRYCGVCRYSHLSSPMADDVEAVFPCHDHLNVFQRVIDPLGINTGLLAHKASKAVRHLTFCSF